MRAAVNVATPLQSALSKFQLKPSKIYSEHAGLRSESLVLSDSIPSANSGLCLLTCCSVIASAWIWSTLSQAIVSLLGRSATRTRLWCTPSNARCCGSRCRKVASDGKSGLPQHDGCFIARIADCGSKDLIIVISLKGKELRRFSVPKVGKQRFARAIATDRQGNVYISMLRCVQVLSRYGQSLGSWPVQHNKRTARGLAVSQNYAESTRVIVSCAVGGRNGIGVFTTNGQLLKLISPWLTGYSMHRLCLDENDVLFGIDCLNDISCISPDGRLLTKLRPFRPDVRTGFRIDMCLAWDGRVFAVRLDEFEAGRITVWRFES